MKKSVTLGIFLSAAFCSLNAAAPSLDSISPAGGNAGTEISITINGKTEPWPCKLHCTDPNVIFTPDPDPKKKNTGKLKIKKEAKIGPVLIRAVNDEGVSDPIIFTISHQTELLEDDKDENSIAKAQPIPAGKIPCVINGKLTSSDEVDSYRIPLKKGQTLTAAMEGYALRSPIDPAFHLYDPKGIRVQLSHDNTVNLDPELVHQATADGDYTLSVVAFGHPATARVNFFGNAKSVYRIHLATDRKQLPERLQPAPLGKDSTNLKNPGQVNGTLSKPGEVDSYLLEAKKGQSLLIKGEAFRFRYPTDPVVLLNQPDGKLIRQIDDTKPARDAIYLWKVPADGKYQLQVKDRFRRGGSDFRYRLSVGPAEPAFSATLDKNRYTLLPGKSLDLKVKLTREYSHKDKLTIRATGLPKGVKLEAPKSIPDKSGEFTAKLTAAKDCKNVSAPFRLFLKETEKKSAKEKPVPFSFQDTASRGPFLINDTPEIWLTVYKKPEPKPKPKPAPKKPAEKKEKKK